MFKVVKVGIVQTCDDILNDLMETALCRGCVKGDQGRYRSDMCTIS